MRIRNPGCKQFGSGMEKVGSGINIPDPQHCVKNRLGHKAPWILHTKITNKNANNETDISLKYMTNV